MIITEVIGIRHTTFFLNYAYSSCIKRNVPIKLFLIYCKLEDYGDIIHQILNNFNLKFASQYHNSLY